MNQKFLDTTTHSVSWFYKRHNADELKLRAPFQRNPVWSENQKSYLIDTILKGFPIPELYVQELIEADGTESYIVVDGQQRLRSCIEFLDNQFAITGSDAIDFDGLYFKDLSDEQRKDIYNYSFVVRKLPDMADTELRAIFRRINRNTVSLNTQELRHSTYSGLFIKLIEDLADDERWSDTGVFTANDVRRMLDIEYIGELVVAYLHGLQNKKSSLDKWYQSYELEFDRDSEVRRVFNSVLSEIGSLVPSDEKTRWRKKSDFYTLFLVLAEEQKSLPFARDERANLRSKLTTFSREVDAFLRYPDEPMPPLIREYARAVDRAASDLANRKERRTQLRLALEL